MAAVTVGDEYNTQEHWNQRVDLACAFRWTVRLGLHEGVANHFSLAVNDSGTKFLMNPDCRHFSRIKARDLLLLDANDPSTMEQPNAPEATAWGLHGALHRHCPHIRCALHAHPIYATVLSSLNDSGMLPIDQNTATFFDRVIIDNNYGGLALEDEGERCVKLFPHPKTTVMVMGNHGVLVTGDSVATAFNRFYYFERAAETLIKAYSTGRELSILSDDVAEKTAHQIESMPYLAEMHFRELQSILDDEEPDYRT